MSGNRLSVFPRQLGNFGDKTVILFAPINYYFIFVHQNYLSKILSEETIHGNGFILEPEMISVKLLPCTDLAEMFYDQCFGAIR